MKNALLKSFVFLFVLVNLIFFNDIIAAFYVVSEAFWLMANFDVMAWILGALYVILFVSFLTYFFLHRDKNEVIETVEFKSPDDMTPVEVGFLVDGVVDGEDMSALLVYWASKKYIEISKNKKNQKLKKLVETLPENARQYEKVLFNKIFGKDKEILVSAVSSRLSGDQSVNNIVSSIEKSVGDKYFNSKAIWFRQIFIILIAVLFYVTVMYFRLEYYTDVVPIIEGFAIVVTALFVLCADWLLNYYDYRHKNNKSKGRMFSFVCFLVLSVVTGGLCAYFFWTDLYQVIFLLCATALLVIMALLSRYILIYNKEGTKKLGQILGFKNFIAVAEEDRIKMLAEENPNIFYDILPYAFVLGVSDKWISHLDVIKKHYPELVNDNIVTNIIVYNALCTNRQFNIINSIRVAQATKIATGAISLGSNGGRGGTKGGSNFGGIRRR